MIVHVQWIYVYLRVHQCVVCTHAIYMLNAVHILYARALILLRIRRREGMKNKHCLYKYL